MLFRLAVMSLLVIVAGAGAPVCVLADGPKPVDSPQYRKLVADGLQEFDRGNWEEANALFEQAHAINPNARTLRALGLCAFEARRYTESLQYLNAAMTDTRKPLTAKQRDELQESIDRAGHYVGGLRLTVDPPEATVRIDGKAVLVDPQKDIIVNAGTLEVEVSAPDYKTEVRRVRIGSQAHEALSVQLSPIRAEPSAPPEPAPLAPAPVVDAPVDDTRDDGNPVGTWKWVTGGVAVVGIAVGVTSLILADADAQKWNECRDLTQESCANRRSRSQGETTIGIVGLAAGGAFAALTVVLFVLDAKDGGSESAARTCGAGPGDVGVQCHVAF